MSARDAFSAMVQFGHPDRHPSIAEAAAHLGVSAEAIDPTFGVIATDPAAGLYTVMVAPAAAAAAAGRLTGAGEGVFGDPPIAPFAPP